MPEPTTTTTPTAVAVAGTGTDVSINDVSDQWPADTPQQDVPTTIGDLEVFGTKVVTLVDGRAIVRGRWAKDDPVESTSAMRHAEGFPEPTIRMERPIRLFLVEWDTESVVPLSPHTETITTETAIGIFSGPEIPLEWEAVGQDTVLRFTTGFNGAAYDIPHTLWEVAIPSI